MSPIRPKLTLTKEKKRKKKQVQGERKEEAIKTHSCTLSFYIDYFGVFGRKKGLTEEVHLAEMFSKIQLIFMKQIGRRCCPGPSYVLHALMILSACLMKKV